MGGNVNWMKAREASKGTTISSEFDVDEEGAGMDYGSDGACDIRDLVDFASTERIVQECNTQDAEDTLEPLVDLSRSDSANLDGCFELMCKSRARAPCALMALVPAAYQNEPALANNPEVVDFYNFHGGLLEAWDGPALLVFCDGKSIGASLDRNGLRPARFSRTEDGTVYMMSETGVIPFLDEATIIEKGRLGPGQMIDVDLLTGEWKDNIKIKSEIASRHPYGEWLKKEAKFIGKASHDVDRTYDDVEATSLQESFGWSLEDISMQINDMASTGKETTYSMGDDAPIAALSERPHPLYNYFKQRFAQVTNPPIDPLREGVVMSLNMVLGKKASIYKVSEKGAGLIRLDSPVLTAPDLEKIKSYENPEKGGFKNAVVSTRYDVSKGPEYLKEAIEELYDNAIAQVLAGAEVIILSDKPTSAAEVDSTTYIPPLAAVGAVHHALIAAGIRMDTGIVIETGAPWSTHHFAMLVGYGAHAVHPYIAFETVKQWYGAETTQKKMSNGRLPEMSIETAQENYKKSIEAGLLKILSKIGISLLTSYHGAQIFEAMGLGAEIIDTCFKGTTSRIGGLSLTELATETALMRPEASTNPTKLKNYGYYKPVPKLGEYHANSADLAKLLHNTIGLDTKANPSSGKENTKAKTPANYEIFKKSLNSATLANLRDLLDFSSDRRPIDISEVEPIEEIMKRFCTGAMSLGALSREAHETLAIAVNRVGGKSNSGEGGEDVLRGSEINDVDENGISKSFPHLRGVKNGDSANSFVHQIASGRFGVTPEFLVTGKQLEIKMAQGAKPGEGGQLPGPKVSEYIAKLRASKEGVTLISPPPHHDIYSIEDLARLIHDLHAINEKAGVSVKLVSSIGIGTVACGVAKADADVIQISSGDGGTGASPLSSIKHAGGPWELGLTEAHSALVMNNLRSRVTLRVDGGVRTGRDVLMGALMGAEEFGFGTIAMIAEGCIMARVCHLNTCPVGVTSQKEELRKKFPGTPEHVVQFFEYVALEVRELLAHLGYKSLEDVIGRCDLLQEDKINMNRVSKSRGMALSELYNEVPDVSKDRSWLLAENGEKKDTVVHINKFSSDPDRKVCKDAKDVIEKGTGTVDLEYDIVNTDRSCGAMLSGDVARKWGNRGFLGKINVTFKGSAGQSFGAFTLPGVNLKVIGEANDYVAKGTGDHCCEYMTGGVVVVLGSVGRNVGAGMTGGVSYFYDPNNELEPRINPEIVKMQKVTTSAGLKQLRTMLERHLDLTGSQKAKAILDDWDNQVQHFQQIYPPSEADSSVIKDIEEKDQQVKISASSFTEECFLTFDDSKDSELVAAYCAD